ncbi:MFS transporter [Rhodovarius crocodyli]|uniref:MFS transporter n=1 Tax=Rhodovarius crocodyli TaxID=1979269 RepID=A0A437MMR9_9PROT|nr:MFS transporter [Rhodovarius crocodyli]RVT98958.1 MFS transporter [Rhodovarius crocodyli]
MSAAPRVNIWLIALAGFASGIGMRMVDPLLPMIAGDFGVQTSQAAILIAAFQLTYGGSQLGTGLIGDRFGKLRLAAISLLAFGIVSILGEFAGGLNELVWMRMIAGLASGAIIPMLMAHIGDTVPYNERQAVLGQFLMGNVMAQLLGGPMSGLIGEHFGWRGTFICFGAFTASIGLVLMALLGRSMLAPMGTGGAGGFAGYARLLKSPFARRLMLAAALDGALLMGGAFPFIPSFLIEDFHLSAAWAGLIVASFGLGAMIYSRMARRLVGRLGESNLLVMGGLGLAICLFITAAAPHWGVILVAEIASGFLFYSFHGVLQARGTEALPDSRATSMAAFAMSLFLGQSLGALVFAGVMAMAGYRAAFALAGLGMVAVAFWCRQAPVREAA